MAYVWLWSRPEWGLGWAIVGTVNLTLLALLALVAVWLMRGLIRRIELPITARDARTTEVVPPQV
jgi:hypothetical protein